MAQSIVAAIARCAASVCEFTFDAQEELKEQGAIQDTVVGANGPVPVREAVAFRGAPVHRHTGPRCRTA